MAENRGIRPAAVPRPMPFPTAWSASDGYGRGDVRQGAGEPHWNCLSCRVATEWARYMGSRRADSGSDRRFDVVVVGAGQGGSGDGLFPGRAGPRFRDRRRGRGARGRMAAAVGLAEAVHAGEFAGATDAAEDGRHAGPEASPDRRRTPRPKRWSPCTSATTTVAPVTAKTQLMGGELLACVMGGVYPNVDGR
jgi:hypothetical protein